MQLVQLSFSDHFVQPILDNQVSKVVQFSFPKGKVLQKHKTSSHILLLLVCGQVRFTAEEEVLFQANQIISLEPNVEHSVEALEDSILLLIQTPSPLVKG